MTNVAAQLEGHLTILRSYARSIARNRSAAEDLVQTTVTRALEKQHLFRPDTNLRGWLLTIMHNDHVNGTRRMIRTPDFAPEEALASIGTPGTQAAPIELHEVRRAVKLLPPRQRQVLLMHWLDEMPYGEIAAALGVPLGTVQSRLYRARARLRQYLAS